MLATTFQFAPLLESSGLKTDLPVFRDPLRQRLLKNMQDAPFGTVAPMRPEFFKQECEPIEMPNPEKAMPESTPKVQRTSSPKKSIGRVMFESNIKMRKVWQQVPAENRESLANEIQQFFEELAKKYSSNDNEEPKETKMEP
ncbi:hypothetical protein DdX_05633 [Ditylenchus destructor]|uniref:Uncharacterized protein n=1 Tax=Ditylenchus destructor TaxID=166010 RepID=A0AAD4R6T0_9BILA|nr:hypothetical protein DdX_05633 [Ditylenchus destructor]